MIIAQAVWDLLGLLALVSAAVFFSRGWLLPRPDTARRFTHRLYAWISFAAWMAWCYSIQSGWPRWTSLAMSVYAAACATEAYHKRENARRAEQGRPWLTK